MKKIYDDRKEEIKALLKAFKKGFELSEKVGDFISKEIEGFGVYEMQHVEVILMQMAASVVYAVCNTKDNTGKVNFDENLEFLIQEIKNIRINEVKNG